jgi:hypothetical protein
MVRLFLFVLLFFLPVFADGLKVVADEELLIKKIKTFVDEEYYNKNKAYIDIIFSPKEDYYKNDRVDPVRVAKTLKENGLLNLFFRKPKELTLNFKTSGSPLFFVKIMGDTLRNIGYYRYVTKASSLNSSEFVWSISLTSEYATDPIILQKELQKSGSVIIDIDRNSTTNWSYTIDISNGYLNVETLYAEEEVKLRRTLYPYWFDVSQIQKIQVESSVRNNWYPYISYYDSSLHLLKVIKKDFKQRKLILIIPSGAKYIKISDIYTLKNIKDGLSLSPLGQR